MSGWHRGPFPRAHLTGDIMPRDAGAFSPVRGSRSGLAGEIMESTKKGLTMRNDHTIGRRAVLAAAAALPFLLSMPAWARAEALPLVTVTKDPSCGCCDGWIAHIEAAGFPVRVVDSDDVFSLKERLGVPAEHFHKEQFHTPTAQADATARETIAAADAEAFWDETGGQVCLKATRGGYDGHGVWFPSSREECAELVEDLLGRDLPLMAEKKVAFTRELSAMVARNRLARGVRLNHPEAIALIADAVAIIGTMDIVFGEVDR